MHPESTKIVHGFLFMDALKINLLSLSDILGIILVFRVGADDDEIFGRSRSILMDSADDVP